jgi:integrase
MYRRPSGIYAVRLVVPMRLRQSVGRGEIHVSTGLHDWKAAKLAALKIQFQWREKLMALDLEKLAAVSPLLQGGGLIPVCDAARAIGLSDTSLLNELRSDRADLFTQAMHWRGWVVSDIESIERDDDGAFILNDVEAKGELNIAANIVQPFDSATTVTALIADGKAEGSIFRLSTNGAFWPMAPVVVPLSAWMAQKQAIERVRARLASAIPIEPPNPPSAPAIPASGGVVVMDAITAKHGHKRFSELFKLFRGHRKWGVDQSRRMATESGLFVELMDDPELTTIDVETIQEYARSLSKLPTDIYQSRRRFKVSSLNDLMEIAEREGLPRKNETTVRGHVSKIAEVLNYAASKGMMHVNPASGFQRGWGVTKKTRPQDDRERFMEAELDSIFSQPWFVDGAGKFTVKGWTEWRPFYFWLPLLALTSGGRLNELAQLYLDDIQQSEKDSAVWYVDFNLNQPDKIDNKLKSDKSLKTVNAMRVVPVHESVIQAGLPEYMAALREAGYVRLFPELKRDEVKGYGKPAGSWFNERLLGDQLGIERNGKKTFHSFRHNFITAIERLDLPERVMAQLAGHERGRTQSGTRYSKDREAEELKQIIDRLAFACLDNVGQFDIQAGIKAIKVAEKYKAALARSRNV